MGSFFSSLCRWIQLFVNKTGVTQKYSVLESSGWNLNLHSIELIIYCPLGQASLANLRTYSG